ncbi:hypothetical protein M407DRAFT_34119 [Tulasnella calospora MUT 4182]|uniref:Uncharacterized protein n=1 Tax=Tulasnella calospora MUT 4182 TaxID=1051891 RepID=A0A0C3L3D3_9AGAM|nr:hypothetical protein M407DRAFT_34119 [Tulasnella calospora MUT 4182]
MKRPKFLNSLSAEGLFKIIDYRHVIEEGYYLTVTSNNTNIIQDKMVQAAVYTQLALDTYSKQRYPAFTANLDTLADLLKGAVEAAIAPLRTDMASNFKTVNDRLTTLDENFKSLERKFTSLESKITGLQTSFGIWAIKRAQAKSSQVHFATLDSTYLTKNQVSASNSVAFGAAINCPEGKNRHRAKKCQCRKKAWHPNTQFKKPSAQQSPDVLPAYQPLVTSFNPVPRTPNLYSTPVWGRRY